MASEQTTRLSAEEADQLSRSVKKQKRNEEAGQTSHDESMVDMDDPSNIWQRASFADALKGLTKKTEIYTGEGEEDPMDDLDISEVIHH